MVNIKTVKNLNPLLSFCLVLSFFACKTDEENPINQSPIEVIGLAASEIVWDTIDIEIKLPENIAAEGLKVMIGEKEFEAIEGSPLQFKINTYNLPEGLNTLKLSHPEVNSGQITQLSFEVRNTLLTVNVDENAIWEDTDLWLIISDAQSQIVAYEKLPSAGQYTFRKEGFKESDYQFSMVRDYALFPIGTVLYVEHLQRGQEIEVKYPEPFQENFGSGDILMKNIPQHDSYKVNNLAGDLSGTKLPNKLPMFFNYIPSRVLVQWSNNGIWKAAFSSQQLTVAGGSVEVDLSQTLSMHNVEIDLPRTMSASFGTAAYPKEGYYFEGYEVDVHSIENSDKINTRHITEGFEEVQANLIFTQNNMFGFYRKRGHDLPSQFEDFTARIEVLNNHHNTLDIKFTGPADFYELYWSNDNFASSEQKRWLVKQIGNPVQGRIPLPNYAELMPNSFFSKAEQDLRAGKLVEADVLESYKQSVADLLGESQYYSRAKNLKQLEFSFMNSGGRIISKELPIKVKEQVSLFERAN